MIGNEEHVSGGKMITYIFNFLNLIKLWSIEVKIQVFGSKDVEFVKEIRIRGENGG